MFLPPADFSLCVWKSSAFRKVTNDIDYFVHLNLLSEDVPRRLFFRNTDHFNNWKPELEEEDKCCFFTCPRFHSAGSQIKYILHKTCPEYCFKGFSLLSAENEFHFYLTSLHPHCKDIKSVVIMETHQLY